ncbi:hypothetical protein GCM10010277_34920 [Streptomyces longisporoflavus]|uniref:hypothetical protein n=1 Tax=Streptomyces longisporoflavus TaxID=28044 RepID=UPI00167EC9AA|nr:hypothetical protein [Streptomyces longisporoflavus]GGV44467.1 hypothetical protein GCM10010277_34920 [Streptomyces longisporoflavus]
MSRETDSSSSGPQGRGGAAYPSGTPPYGSPAQGAASDGASDGAQRQTADERPDEPKTETTLTTRVRINIPGSRPIPPVVMRTPVAESDVNARPRGAGRAADGTGAGDGAGRPGPVNGAGGTANGAGGPGSTGMSAPGSAPGPAGSSAAGSSSAPAPSPAPAEEKEKTSDWFAPRKSPTSSTGPTSSTSTNGGNSANGAAGSGTGGSGTGSFDVSGAVASGPLGNGAPQGGDPQRGDLPYFSGGAGGAGGAGGDGGRGPSGPTSGPVTGDGPMAPNPAAGPRTSDPSDPANQANPAGRANPMAPPTPGGPGHPGAPGNPGGPGNRPNPANPAAGSGAGAGAGPGGPVMSDDTAILTPQKAGPVHGGPGSIPGGPSAPKPGTNVSGDTLTSGIPVVPPAQNSPFTAGPQAEGPVPHTPPKLPEPVQPNVPVAAAPAKKKGRNKLVLVAVAVVVVACGAYGAGLLMNHADVPKGTTVLGVDIGGGTRDEAVKKLDAAIGEDVAKPLKLSVDGETVTLKPDQAGLTLDSQATVREAAGSDYNPVSVIGSLFGGARVAEPVMPVDEEKLAAALERAAGGSGSAREGSVKFVPGKAVAVYGKAGKGIDVGASTKAVSEAYRKQVETGSAGTVNVPVTTRKPTVSNAEVDKFMTRFAEPAMSANVTIKAGSASIPFGPAKSLPKVLQTKVLKNGTLQVHYNTAELKKLYGNVFDGILIQRGNGDKTPVQPTDVAAAMNKALIGKTPAERVGVIETNAG